MDFFENESGALVEQHRRLARVDGLDTAGQLFQLGDAGLVVDVQALRQMRSLGALPTEFPLDVFSFLNY